MKIVNRVFYINVDGVSPNDVASYMDSVKLVLSNDENDKISSLKKEGTWEDFFIPVRGDQHLGLLEKIYGFLFGNPKTTIRILKVDV